MSTDHQEPGDGSGTWTPLPPTAPPQRRRARIAVAALGAALLVVGLAAVTGGLTSDSQRLATVGDCVARVELPIAPGETPVSRTPAEPVPCADQQAVYRVAISMDGGSASCPSPIYREYREVADPAELRTLCLTYNVGEGECFVETPAEAGRFDCGSGPRLGGIKILRLFTGVTDPQRCAGLDEPDVIPAIIPEPAMTFCYVNFLPGSPGEVPRSA
ncbi:MAG: LppU/SCO3897 family protein [Sporichthyaceae bacterium]